MTIETQLADLITSANNLVQTVAAKDAAINAAVAAALQTTRVYTNNGIKRARSVAHYIGGPANDGVWVIKTPIKMTDNVMMRLDIKGYDYGGVTGDLIDLHVATYITAGVNAPDGTTGWFVSSVAQRPGTSTKNAIWLGEDPATGNACVVFGTPLADNNITSFVVDGAFNFNTNVDTDPAHWSVASNNSAAPGVGVTTGFGGLINLLSV